MFETLKNPPPDSLLALIKAFADDPRAGKIDLGVGVYRDDSGATPIMQAVKDAERILFEAQDTKSYLGPEGDMRFVAALQPLVFDKSTSHVTGIQTPGGSGALRLGAELITAARPGARVWVGTPTWPNHGPVFQSGGLTVCRYRFFDTKTQTILFDEMMAALSGAAQGDVVLLHGCCHNPTGADLDLDQWREVADLIARRGLFPFIDLAYQGLGRGLDEDVAGLRLVLDATDEALVAYSCDKNFALYRDRTGALFAQARTAAHAGAVFGSLAGLARVNWSMPPDHGAALVRIVLESPDLTRSWREELVSMCARIGDVRRALATLEPQLAFLDRQRGLFSNLALAPEQIDALRTRHAIYMAPSGRANLAGMRASDAGKFVAALADVGGLERAKAAVIAP
ncbi:amino acid aminotransferase [Bradyrhizobium prioriisuperbiae]|uniref:amino acid aminotransferase n=1 Tax=Bradyrhizobium prioriisuperbiae TaxID=2854389 RepID=UPI0028E23249|nr:amino acid aminotransferase [Bradyrhizobium prioritasuperba]